VIPEDKKLTVLWVAVAERPGLDPDTLDYDVDGVFTSERLAEVRQEQLAAEPREGLSELVFFLASETLGQVGWAEGFVTV
jgi:hypothetical protein